MAELEQIISKRGFECHRLLVHPQPQPLSFEARRPIVTNAADGGDRRRGLTRPAGLA